MTEPASASKPDAFHMKATSRNCARILAAAHHIIFLLFTLKY